MRSLGKRLDHLRNLFRLRCGPGAAILPPEVTRIHMDFAIGLKNGHMGPRKFWRDFLPRLKYHNPAIPLIVNRHTHNENPPIMTIYLRQSDNAAEAEQSPSAAPIQPSSSRDNLSKAQPPGPGERTVRIDMQNKHSDQILELFMKETRAIPLQLTAEEIAERADLEARRKRGEVDRERVRRIRAEKQREEDMLKRARELGGAADPEEA